MGTGKSELYSGTHGSSSDAVGTTKQQKEKNKKVAEKRKETIRKKLEAVKNLFENGRISLDRVKNDPYCLETITVLQFKRVLRELGYKSLRIKHSDMSSSDRTRIIKISNQGKGHNINQVQFSYGGGRHGESPYIKISTTNQGKIKVVFGKKSKYRNEGNEKATIIFTEK